MLQSLGGCKRRRRARLSPCPRLADCIIATNAEPPDLTASLCAVAAAGVKGLNGVRTHGCVRNISPPSGAQSDYSLAVNSAGARALLAGKHSSTRGPVSPDQILANDTFCDRLIRRDGQPIWFARKAAISGLSSSTLIVCHCLPIQCLVFSRLVNATNVALRPNADESASFGRVAGLAWLASLSFVKKGSSVRSGAPGSAK
jgi:hypothetical protein